MIALPLTLLTLLAFAAAAPAVAPTDAPTDAPTTLVPAAAAASEDASAQHGGGSVAGDSPYELSLEEDSEEEAPEGELGLGEDMEGAENIVFRPLFRYRERASTRRRIRNSNRRRDTNYRRTYAARFPHYRYRSAPKRRTASYNHNHHQILY